MPDVPPDATCLTCGYPLRGLAVPRCPECGTAFDPRRADTYRLPAPPVDLARNARRLLRSGVAELRDVYLGTKAYGQLTLELAVLLSLVTLIQRARRDEIEVVSVYLLVVWLVVVPRWVIGMVRPRGRRSPRGWRLATGLILLFLVVMPLHPWTRTCQHGRVWTLGRLGVARSPVGSPCPVTMPGRLAIPAGGDWYLVLKPEAEVAGRWRQST